MKDGAYMNSQNTTMALKIGLVGGLSYPSTITYYQRLNELFNQRLGRAHSARIVLESLDFQPMAEWLTSNNGTAVTGALLAASRRLVDAGADLVAMCCNTVHKYAGAVESGIEVPLINICRSTASEAAARGARTVGLLGSAYSMEESFYRNEFEREEIRVLVPELSDRRFMQQAIESELSAGAISPQTRERFIRIAQELRYRAVDAIVLACTEIPLVIRQQDIEVPIIDTVEVHCASIVSHAFGDTTLEPRSTSCVLHI